MAAIPASLRNVMLIECVIEQYTIDWKSIRAEPWRIMDFLISFHLDLAGDVCRNKCNKNTLSRTDLLPYWLIIS